MALVTAKEIARELHCSVSTVYGLTSRREIPCVRVGHLVRFSLERVLAALDRNATDAPALVSRKSAG